MKQPLLKGRNNAQIEFFNDKYRMFSSFQRENENIRTKLTKCNYTILTTFSITVNDSCMEAIAPLRLKPLLPTSGSWLDMRSSPATFRSRPEKKKKRMFKIGEGI